MPKGIPRDTSVNHAIIHRLKIAHGHLETVINMVKRGAYCINVINQSQAVQAALKHADRIIMQNHLTTCVASEMKKGNIRNVVKEVMDIMNKTDTATHTCCCHTCSCKPCPCACPKDKKGKCTCDCKDCTCNK